MENTEEVVSPNGEKVVLSPLSEKLFQQQLRLTKNNPPMRHLLRGVEGLVDISTIAPEQIRDDIRKNVCLIVSGFVVTQSKTKKAAEKLYDDVIDYIQDFEQLMIQE